LYIRTLTISTKVFIDKQIKFCFHCGSFCVWVSIGSHNQTKQLVWAFDIKMIIQRFLKIWLKMTYFILQDYKKMNEDVIIAKRRLL